MSYVHMWTREQTILPIYIVERTFSIPGTREKHLELSECLNWNHEMSHWFVVTPREVLVYQQTRGCDPETKKSIE